MKTTTVLSFAMLLSGLSTSATATTVTVLGTEDIYGAGVGDGSGIAPTLVTAGISSGVGLEFSSVTVTPVSCNSVLCAGGNDADGGVYSGIPNATSVISPGNGISGISFSGRDMFLVGVFINTAALPTTGSGPTALNYGVSGSTTGSMQDGSDLPTFEPALNQVFFIGDGTEGFNGVCPALTVAGFPCSNGQQQITYAPTGANELFLGFVDANSMTLNSIPGGYGDNTGNLSVTVTALPEPGTMMLMGLGLAACALLRKKLA